MKRMTCLAVVILATGNVAFAGFSYTWYEYNGHEYALTSQWQSWNENQAEAVTQGGYLAVINSVEENAWLTHTFANTYQQDGEWNHGDPGWKSLVDIGYYQASDGNWKWINGETGVDNPSQFYYSHPIGYPIPGTKAYLHVEGHYSPGTWNSAIYVTDPDSGWGYEPTFGIIERDTVIAASVDIDPDTFNLNSKGRWVTCYVRLPEGHEASDIDVDSVSLEGLLEVQQSDIQDGVLMVKFDREDLAAYVEVFLGVVPPAEVELVVMGNLTDGTPFEGSDTIRVIDEGGGK